MEIAQSYDRMFSQFSWETVKFGAFVFVKVVRQHEWREVENAYVAQNFSHFAIYLRKVLQLIEICRSFDRNNFAQFFLRHRIYV